MKTQFTIAVADDDIDDQELMRKGLSDANLKVQVTSLFNGLQLMDYLLKRENFKKSTEIPDLILLDLNMPLMDGYDVLKEIRRYKHLQPIPVYVITTSKRKEDEILARELGATGFYSKGASEKEIRDIMFTICAPHIQRDQESSSTT